MEKSAMEAKDLKSGILLRDNSRVMTEEEILEKVNKREFKAIEELDKEKMRNEYSLTN